MRGNQGSQIKPVQEAQANPAEHQAQLYRNLFTEQTFCFSPENFSKVCIVSHAEWAVSTEGVQVCSTGVLLQSFSSVTTTSRPVLLLKRIMNHPRQHFTKAELLQMLQRQKQAHKTLKYLAGVDKDLQEREIHFPAY